MKKIYILLLSLMGLTATTWAQETQDQPEMSEKKQQDIQALKAAFITKELDLTPDEAQKFWPVYNQYEKEITTVIKDRDNDDALEKEERVLNIRKKYKEQFTKVLGNQQRMNRMFNAEGKFRRLLIKSLQQRQMKRAMRNNRPGLRN